MNSKSSPRFQPSSPLLRSFFAAIALAATAATGEFIDALAQGRGTTAPLAVHAATVIVAQR
jgi:hypothetical protein